MSDGCFLLVGGVDEDWGCCVRSRFACCASGDASIGKLHLTIRIVISYDDSQKFSSSKWFPCAANVSTRWLRRPALPGCKVRAELLPSTCSFILNKL